MLNLQNSISALFTVFIIVFTRTKNYKNTRIHNLGKTGFMPIIILNRPVKSSLVLYLGI